MPVLLRLRADWWAADVISDERRDALVAYNRVRSDMQRAAIDAVERVHGELHSLRWHRDNPGTVIPPVSELCVSKIECTLLSQAVNKVKHALARVEA